MMRKQKTFITITTFAIGCTLCLVAFQALNTGIGGLPKIWAPCPAPLIIPRWLGTPLIIVITFWTLAMWAWNPNAFTGKKEIPKRSFILFLLLGCLSVFYNIAGIPFGKQYQGEFYTQAVTVINFSLIAVLISIGIWARRKPSFPLNLIFHWLMFAWMISYAFPYLGELP